MTHFKSEEEFQIFLSRNALKKMESIGNDTPDSGPEKNLLNKCLNYCKERGYPCWHDRSRKKNQPGWPDLIIFVPEGHVILIELKSAKGVFRNEQQQLARQFMYLKHRYYKVRSFVRFLGVMNATTGGDKA